MVPDGRAHGRGRPPRTPECPSGTVKPRAPTGADTKVYAPVSSPLSTFATSTGYPVTTRIELCTVEPSLHPLLEPLAELVGTWTGRGRGTYPTIDPFEYTETTTFTHVGKPFLTFVQRTRDASTGAPMHTEMGYWRVVGSNRLELVISHAFGATEICEGSFTNSSDDGGLKIHVASTSLVTTTTAKEVNAVERDFAVDRGEMHYELRMAAVGIPMEHHLAATLTVEDGTDQTD